MKKDPKRIAFWCALLGFLAIFLIIYGFEFARNNNLEELPLFYKILQAAPYTGDYYVNFHTSHFTQITPYLILVSLLAWPFGPSGLPVVFFILYLLTIAAIYLGIRALLKNLFNTAELGVLVINVVLAAVLYLFPELIPTHRWLYNNFLDPELVEFALLIWIVVWHTERKYLPAAVLLFISTFHYAIYALPLFPALAISLGYQYLQEKNQRAECLKVLFWYFLAVFPFSFIMWLLSRQTLPGIDMSLIMEFVRAPWHYRIPTLGVWDWSMTYFSLFSLVSLYFGWKTLPQKPAPKISQTYLILVSLIGLLVVASLTAAVIRIPLLVQIAPYRISVIVLVIGWVFIFGKLWADKLNKLELSSPQWLVFLGLTVVLANCIFPLRLKTPDILAKPDHRQMVSWINQNTPQDALFVNYSDIDISTECLRPEYFEFKRIPLTADMQREWFHRWQVQGGLDKLPADVTKMNGTRVYNFASVVGRAGIKIDYIVIDIPDQSLHKYNPVYSTGKYILYRVKGN